MATPIERSVDCLQRLYAVVVGLALIEGLRNSVTATNQALPTASFLEKAFRAETWPIIALVFALVPFFHGANRHLDNTYIFGTGKEKQFVLMVDFCFFLLQGTTFYWMALVISYPQHFFHVYCVLLFIDILWGIRGTVVDR